MCRKCCPCFFLSVCVILSRGGNSRQRCPESCLCLVEVDGFEDLVWCGPFSWHALTPDISNDRWASSGLWKTPLSADQALTLVSSQAISLLLGPLSASIHSAMRRILLYPCHGYVSCPSYWCSVHPHRNWRMGPHRKWRMSPLRNWRVGTSISLSVGLLSRGRKHSLKCTLFLSRYVFLAYKTMEPLSTDGRKPRKIILVVGSIMALTTWKIEWT